jgi:ATP-dependent RNA helicase DHX8/PRP22
MHGKLYPVDVKYYTIKQSVRVEEAVKATIRMHLHEGPGDILVFLTGS